jgi:hypothetical protein
VGDFFCSDSNLHSYGVQQISAGHKRPHSVLKLKFQSGHSHNPASNPVAHGRDFHLYQLHSIRRFETVSQRNCFDFFFVVTTFFSSVKTPWKLKRRFKATYLTSMTLTRFLTLFSLIHILQRKHIK